MKFALAKNRTVTGTTYVWKIGKSIARKRHVKQASRVDPISHQVVKAVIKGPEYDSKKAVSRFKAELSGMRELTSRGTDGVFPILDWQENADELWYVMPTATPLADELAGADFDVVVRTIATLAGTLDALSHPSSAATGPLTVAHRDIKPENLFWHDGGPVLADFGIAAWFDDTSAATKTQEGDSLGPRNYLAPEARYCYDGIDWPPADIYSLAMTFWSLSEKRRVPTDRGSTVALPPPGTISASDGTLSMARFGGPDAATLNVLMEQATSLRPTDRPTAAEFRDELQTWLEMYPGPHARPEYVSMTGFGPLRRIMARIELGQREFLDVLRPESRSALGRVEFDATVTVDYEPRGQSNPDGSLRSAAIMDKALHGRSKDDEWDGSFVVAFRSSDGIARLVIGGTFDVPGRVDWIAESHVKKNGSWELVTSTEEPDLLIGRLTTRKIIREFLASQKSISGSEGPVMEVSWTAERVM